MEGNFKTGILPSFPLKFFGFHCLLNSSMMKRERMLGPPAVIAAALSCVGKTSAFQLVSFHHSVRCILTVTQHAHVPPQWRAAASAAECREKVGRTYALRSLRKKKARPLFPHSSRAPTKTTLWVKKDHQLLVQLASDRT